MRFPITDVNIEGVVKVSNFKKVIFLKVFLYYGRQSQGGKY